MIFPSVTLVNHVKLYHILYVQQSINVSIILHPHQMVGLKKIGILRIEKLSEIIDGWKNTPQPNNGIDIEFRYIYVAVPVHV